MSDRREVLASAFDSMESSIDATETPPPAVESSAAADSNGDAGASPDAGGGITPDADSPGGSSERSDTHEGMGRQPAAGSARARDISGRFAKAEQAAAAKAKQQATPQAAPSVTPAPKPAEGAPSTTPPPAPGETTVALKAPQSWKPAAREEWAKLPAAVQAEVDRREKEMQTGLREAAEKAKRGDVFQQAVAPFENHIRRQGGDPVKAVHSMLQIGYTLETGTEQNKAALLAHLFKASGVSEDALVNAITGQGGPAAEQGSQGGQPTHMDPRAIAAQVRQELMEGLQQQAQQRQATKAQEELAAWSQDKEFFEDVRGTMEGLIRAKIARGFQDAYDKACKLHPDVAPIMAQREAAKAATASQAAMQRTQDAASSVKSRPAGISGSKATGRRAQLEAVIGDLSGR